MSEIAAHLDLDLRTATPDRYVGVVLMDGLGGGEEEVNHALGIAAPTVQFVGGSAGDGLRFDETRVFCNGEASGRGAVLLLLDMSAPFTVLKTESVEQTGQSLQVTGLDESGRFVHAFDGRPADRGVRRGHRARRRRAGLAAVYALSARIYGGRTPVAPLAHAARRRRQHSLSEPARRTARRTR